jgi:hypothetical protein
VLDQDAPAVHLLSKLGRRCTGESASERDVLAEPDAATGPDFASPTQEAPLPLSLLQPRDAPLPPAQRFRKPLVEPRADTGLDDGRLPSLLGWPECWLVGLGLRVAVFTVNSLGIGIVVT